MYRLPQWVCLAICQVAVLEHDIFLYVASIPSRNQGQIRSIVCSIFLFIMPGKIFSPYEQVPVTKEDRMSRGGTVLNL